MIRCWRLDSPQQTFVLASRDGRLPEVLYWGAPLSLTENLDTLAAVSVSDVTGGMIDARPPMTICPLPEDVFPGARGADIGAVQPCLRLVAEEGDNTNLTLTFGDGNALYILLAQVDADTDVITLTARMKGVNIRWLSAPAVPGPLIADEMVTFSGKWIGEFQSNRLPWTTGAHLREIRDGRTSHEGFPGLIMPTRGATNTQGEVFALHLGQSTGHRMIAEQLPDGRRHVLMGPMLHPAGAEDVTSGPLYITRTGEGLNGVSHAFHRHVRKNIVKFPQPDRPRPVHYNCWEAVYFEHDLTELKDIATRAAEIGAERFVLDDGWFERRDDDTSSLGDWFVDARKYPNGLRPLIDHVHDEGMTFGLWVEPEMMNPNSALARARPHWIIGPMDQPLARQQLVLDLALPEVSDYLFERIDALLSEYPIDYLKWDHNRVLPGPDHNQAEAVYALMDRLLAKHPGVEIESCASGGARIDFGILKRTHRVWLSDSNDALERARIQHEAMLFLPPEVTGSHIGPAVCHTSGRQLSLPLRAHVAASRHFGFEMDPRELSGEEIRRLRLITEWWKSHRDWLHTGRMHRLDLADPHQLAEMTVATDRSKFVVRLVQMRSPSAILPRPVRLTGLDPHKTYTVRIVNHDDITTLSRAAPALKQGPVTMTGAALMQMGLMLPYTVPEQIWTLEGVEDTA